MSAKKPKLADFAGLLTDEEADELEKNIRESRKMSRERMERIRKLMNKQ